MQPIEIVVIIVCVLAIVGVIAGRFINKKRGKSSCCDDCSSCPYNCKCKSNNSKKK